MITLQERVHSCPRPVGWSLSKLHRVFKVRKGFKNIGMQEDNLLSLSYGRIIRKSIDAAEGLLPESFETYQIVEPGNIVMRLTDLQNDKRSLRQGLVKERGIITSAYDALELEKGHDPRFWAYALLALDLAKYYYSLGGGVRQSIKFQDFPNDWIATPDTETQRNIADFLDRETARIDELTEKKIKLSRILAEKNQVASIAIVTGRDCIERKVSSITWAGSIPSHWQERAVWMLFELGRGRVISHEDIGRSPGPYPIYSSQTADEGVLGYIDTFDFDGDYLTWTTDGAKAGTVFRRSGKFNCTNVCGTLKPLDKRIDLHYFQFALDRATDFFVRHDINPKLMNGVMSKIRVPFPPYAEQENIGRHLKEHQNRLMPLLDKIDASIERLSQYRSALITAAVTHQINVATWGKQGHSDRRLDQIGEDMDLRETSA